MSKKLIIAFSALALAILAGAIAVVGVFAAQQQKVANTFTISYSAKNVKASVFGAFWYKNAGDEDFAIDQGAAGGYSVSFSPEEAEQTKEINPSITLTAEKPAVKLLFGIENYASAGGKSLSITLTDTTAVKENVNVYYAHYMSNDGNPNAISYADIVADETYKTVPDTVTIQPSADSGGYSAMFIVIIEIADPTLDAKYETTEDAGLHFALESVD